MTDDDEDPYARYTANSRTDAHGLTLAIGQGVNSAKQAFIAHGAVQVKTPTPPLLYQYRLLRAATLRDIAGIWWTMREHYRACLLLGSPTDQLDLAGLHPRRLKPREGEPATLRSVPRKVVVLDLDGPELPDSLASVADALEQPEVAVRHVRGLLPAPFNRTACAWSWSSSMGFRADRKARLRLGFILSHAVHPGHLGMLMAAADGGAPVDPASFRPVQPIYTARAILHAGVSSPFTPEHRRIGVMQLPGEPDIAEIDLADIAAVVQVTIADLVNNQNMRLPQAANAILSAHGLFSLADLEDAIVEGKEGLHDAMRSMTYRLACSGLPPREVWQRTHDVLQRSNAKHTTPTRWQDRLHDLKRTVETAFERRGQNVSARSDVSDLFTRKEVG